MSVTSRVATVSLPVGAALFLIVVGCTRSPAVDVNTPRLVEAVNDFAQVIPAAARRDLDEQIQALRVRTRDVVVVATVPTIAPVTDMRRYSMSMFDNGGKGIGERGKDNGVLVLLAIRERQIRITVGRGMEGVVTDAIAAGIVEEMTPSFRRGDYGGGLAIGVRRLAATLVAARLDTTTEMPPPRSR